MSGGVDSSVAAYLLKKQGYSVVGVFIRGYNIDGCGEMEAEDARRVAEALGIPFYVFDLEDEYKKLVVKYMVEGYRKGITPNPDVMCNKEIKFGLFLDKAVELGADYIATGHYVRLKSGKLFEAKDKNKDQSYFLWTLTQEQLKYCLFPIGDYLKRDVREIARRAGLPTAEKKDSQGICFLGKITLSDFLKQYLPEKRGLVYTTDGKKIGEHPGAWFYTIGQRQGLGIGGSKLPYYVAEKDVKGNVIKVAEGEDNPSLYRDEIELENVNFISSPSSNSRELANRVLARVRYRQPLSSASISKIGETYKIKFDKPQKFVAPGQSAVIYSRTGEVLGGGVIV